MMSTNYLSLLIFNVIWHRNIACNLLVWFCFLRLFSTIFNVKVEFHLLNFVGWLFLIKSRVVDKYDLKHQYSRCFGETIINQFKETNFGINKLEWRRLSQLICENNIVNAYFNKFRIISIKYKATSTKSNQGKLSLLPIILKTNYKNRLLHHRTHSKYSIITITPIPIFWDPSLTSSKLIT